MCDSKSEIVRRVARLLVAAAAVAALGEGSRADQTVAATSDNAPKTIELWPDGAPGAVGNEAVDRPTLEIHLPPKDRATGAAVVICPGGAYVVLAIDHEGRQVAQWLNSIGVAGFVLKYRLGPRYHYPAALDDAQRSLRYVRSEAKQLGLDPQRVGIMGFSAGGHLTAMASTHYDAGKAEANDPIDRQSCRPNFSILSYPVVSTPASDRDKAWVRMLAGDRKVEEMLDELSAEKHVTAKTPPAFLFHTSEDRGVPVDHSIAYYQALQHAGVSAELHAFAQGPHGVGLAPGDGAADRWPALAATWMRQSGLLTGEKRLAISGRVTIDGKPLNRGWVTLTPIDANGKPAEAKPIASAYVDNDGKFAMDERHGPCAGKHRVVVREVATAFLATPSIDAMREYTRQSPASTMDWTVDVAESNHAMPLEIRTK
jgi:acetyl esterase/lipase